MIALMVNIWQKPAAVICVEQNKARMAEIRSTPEWFSLREAWLIGKVCLICGKPAQVPHHPTLDLYEEIQTYYNLSHCEPYCFTHHRKLHSGWQLCPACCMELMTPGSDHCWRCHVEAEEKETKNSAVMRTCICPHCLQPQSSSRIGRGQCQHCRITFDHTKHTARLR